MNPSPASFAYRASYDLRGFRADVATNSEEFASTLGRLNSELRARSATAPHATYVAEVMPDGSCVLLFQGEPLTSCDSVLEAASHIEWHMCGQAIDHCGSLLHVHGAALATSDASVLMPGSGGTGKTTFALALRLRGLRLLSDDVVFLEPGSWQPKPFPRSLHIHDDALGRLVHMGLRYRAEEHLGSYLCASAFAPWDEAPGPRVRYVIFPRFEAGSPVELEPLTHAEAGVELMRVSRNLRSFAHFGLDLLTDLFRDAECYALQRSDLEEATNLLCERLGGNDEPGARDGGYRG